MKIQYYGGPLDGETETIKDAKVGQTITKGTATYTITAPGYAMYKP